MIRSALVSVAILLSVNTVANSQTIVTPVLPGVCAVDVLLTPPAAADTQVQLAIAKNWLGPITATAGATMVSIVVAGPLGAGDELQVRRIVAGKASEPTPAVQVSAGAGAPQCAQVRASDTVPGDDRETFDASGYLGAAVDNFAPAAVGGYADPEAGGRQKRVVGGVDFEFRALGKQGSRRQLWLFGETLHGVRSADINCTDPNDRPAVCNTLRPGPGGNAGQQFQYILDNASSMEAFGGFRYEFATLQRDSTPAKLYVTARLGVMLLNGEASTGQPVPAVPAPQAEATQKVKANSAYEAHHVGVGLLMPSGSFGGSMIEVGWGVTELFDHVGAKSGWSRLKIDGALSFKLKGPMYGFIQLYADFDPKGPGADSVQTFYGLSFQLAELVQ